MGRPSTPNRKLADRIPHAAPHFPCLRRPRRSGHYPSQSSLRTRSRQTRWMPRRCPCLAPRDTRARAADSSPLSASRWGCSRRPRLRCSEGTGSLRRGDRRSAGSRRRWARSGATTRSPVAPLAKALGAASLAVGGAKPWKARSALFPHIPARPPPQRGPRPMACRDPDDCGRRTLVLLCTWGRINLRGRRCAWAAAAAEPAVAPVSK